MTLIATPSLDTTMSSVMIVPSTFRWSMSTVTMYDVPYDVSCSSRVRQLIVVAGAIGIHLAKVRHKGPV